MNFDCWECSLHNDCSLPVSIKIISHFFSQICHSICRATPKHPSSRALPSVFSSQRFLLGFKNTHSWVIKKRKQSTRYNFNERFNVFRNQSYERNANAGKALDERGHQTDHSKHMGQFIKKGNLCLHYAKTKSEQTFSRSSPTISTTRTNLKCTEVFVLFFVFLQWIQIISEIWLLIYGQTRIQYVTVCTGSQRSFMDMQQWGFNGVIPLWYWLRFLLELILHTVLLRVNVKDLALCVMYIK